MHIFYKSLVLGSRPAPQTTLKADVSVEGHVSHYRREKDLGGPCLQPSVPGTPVQAKQSGAHAPLPEQLAFMLGSAGQRSTEMTAGEDRHYNTVCPAGYPHLVHVSSYFLFLYSGK